MKYVFLFGDYRHADTSARDQIAISVQNFSTQVVEGDENGCRVEIQLVSDDASSPSAAKVTTLREPVWRADMFSTLTDAGSLDRMHYHPTFDGQEPCDRVYADAAAKSDPVQWLAGQLSHLPALLHRAGRDDMLYRVDTTEVQVALPEILHAVRASLTVAPRSGAGAAS
jgi:hypothetical protein